jgi:hypothetical protein
MPELAKDTVTLFGYLLPGFLAAWILYGLTSNPKPSQFERVVQALILTFLVHAALPIVEYLLIACGKVVVTVRPWDEYAIQSTKLCVAIFLGVVLAYYTNTDSIHSWLRDRGFTTRTSYPSEWFGVFSQQVSYVVLQLQDGRRLYGWPKEWPADSLTGHFYVMQPSWIKDDGKTLDLPTTNGILISAKDVKWVEFIDAPKEISHEKR